MLKAVFNVLKQKQPISTGVSPEEVQKYAAQVAARAKQKVGSGQFGQVYEAAPGVVTKELDIVRKNNFLNEVNLQAKAAELGIAPVIYETSQGPIQAFGKTFPIENEPNPQLRGTITMQDLRQNYVPLELTNDLSGVKNPALTQQQYDRANLITQQQLAQLALNKINLHDRHGQNTFVNALTGRPVQLDFGSATNITNIRQQAAAIAGNVSVGLNYANLPEEASIFKGLFNELIQTDPNAALDIAKQGLSRLQKIKMPINPDNYQYAMVSNPQDFIPTY